jgi:DNA-binding transcriptional regulator YbjK
MRHNTQRRAHLLHTAVSLLAREGAAGLSYRTLDEAAAVPTGTASNYFRTRLDLHTQLAHHIHDRLQPDQAFLNSVSSLTGPALHTALLENLVERVRREREAYLALLELRLLAQRHPDLQAVLLPIIRANLQMNEQFSGAQALTADREMFLLGYLALTGLFFEDLTAPGMLPPQASQDLIRAIVRISELQSPAGPAE